MKPGYTPLVYPYPLGGAPSYTLTVVNGSGSGSYASGTIVDISANTNSNEAFLVWSGLDIANTNSSNTTVTMPATNLTVTANLGPPAPSDLRMVPP